MKKKQMSVDFHAYLFGVTHMRQEFTVCQIKSHFSIVCRFYLFSLLFMTARPIRSCFSLSSSCVDLLVYKVL